MLIADHFFLVLDAAKKVENIFKIGPVKLWERGGGAAEDRNHLESGFIINVVKAKQRLRIGPMSPLLLLLYMFKLRKRNFFKNLLPQNLSVGKVSKICYKIGQNIFFSFQKNGTNSFFTACPSMVTSDFQYFFLSLKVFSFACNWPKLGSLILNSTVSDIPRKLYMYSFMNSTF